MIMGILRHEKRITLCMPEASPAHWASRILNSRRSFTSVTVKKRIHSSAAVALLVALLGLTLWTYRDTLHSPFHFDDSLFLQSPQVTSPGNLFHLFRPEQTRQLTYLTLYWNYLLGGANPEGYHLVNLLLHLANTLLMFVFVRLLIARPPGEPDNFVRNLLPVAAAGIFALHPIQSEAVNYAYQRSTLLAAFFILLSLIAYFRSENVRQRAALRALAVVFWLLAAVSKESAWILPLVLVAFLWTHRPEGRAFKEAFKRTGWIIAAGAILTLAGSLWVYFSVRLDADHTIGRLLPAESFRYLIDEIQAFAAYLKLLAWPAGLSVDHDFKAASAWSLRGLSCLLLLLALLAATVRVRKANPTVSFLGMMFFLLLAPTSSILPSSDLLFEHRLYLPMIAASVLFAWGILSAGKLVSDTYRIRLVVCVGVFGVLLSAYSVLSRERTYIWGNDIRLWSDAVAKAPHNSRAHYNLGVAYLGVDKEAARREFARVDERPSYIAAALYNLGWIDQSSGRYDSAREHYLASLKFDSSNWRTHQNLGNVYVYQGRIPDGMTQFRETISLNPGYWPAYRSLATLQIQQGYPEDALPTLRKLMKLQPDLLEAEYLYAWALEKTGRFGRAEHALDRVETRDSAGDYRPRVADLRQEMKSRAGGRSSSEAIPAGER